MAVSAGDEEEDDDGDGDEPSKQAEDVEKLVEKTL